MNEVTQSQGQFLTLLDDDISRVFHTSPVKAKGVEVGVSIALKSNKDIRAALAAQGITDKDEVADAILTQQDAAWRKVRGEIAALNNEWTMHKVTRRNLADGTQQITLVGRKYSRAQFVSDEKAAKAWFPEDKFPGMTLAEKVVKIGEMREKMQKELAAKQITDVTSTVTDSKAPEPKPAVDAAPETVPTATPEPAKPIVDETEEAELARMLAEEEAANAAKS